MTDTPIRAPSMRSTPYVAIVLAGQRPGTDPVAAANHRSAKALAPAFGVPMIDRVVAALERSDQVGRIILVEDASLEPLTTSEGLRRRVEVGVVSITRAKDTICASVEAVMRELPAGENVLVTTADNPLLTPEIITEFAEAAAGADAAIGMVDRRSIEMRYPGIARTYFPFADMAVSGANLFALHGSGGAKAVQHWRLIEAHRKNPLRVFAAFGLENLIGGALRLFTVFSAFARLSRRIGVEVRPVILRDAEAAIDVDKVADLLIADGILARRSIANRREAA